MLTQENLKADSPDAMGKIEKVEGTEKMKELIHKVPLEAFEGIANVTKQAKRYWKHTPRKKPSHKLENADDIILFPQEDEMTQVEKMLVMWNTMQEENSEFEESETDHDNNLKTLLLEYRKQFIETAEFIKAKNEPIPLSLQEAISHIDNQIGYHWVRKS
jgi:excinuclease UvrABC nuclease subunit